MEVGKDREREERKRGSREGRERKAGKGRRARSVIGLPLV